MQKRGFGSIEMSANVPVCVSPACLLCTSRLKQTSFACPRADCSGQLRYHSSTSALFYCYLLIGRTKDEGDVFYLHSAC